jgi:hypothetical protein
MCRVNFLLPQLAAADGGARATRTDRIEDAVLERTAAGPLFATYSKDPSRAFDNATRVARNAELERAIAAELDAAKAWPDHHPKRRLLRQARRKGRSREMDREERNATIEWRREHADEPYVDFTPRDPEDIEARKNKPLLNTEADSAKHFNLTTALLSIFALLTACALT